jgi:hypothetical protein
MVYIKINTLVYDLIIASDMDILEIACHPSCNK